MGVFEWERFRDETEEVAKALLGHDGFTVVGGGDLVAALRMLGLEGEVSHLSTGAGAGLEMLEGKALPGLVALERWAEARRDLKVGNRKNEYIHPEAIQTVQNLYNQCDPITDPSSELNLQLAARHSKLQLDQGAMV